MAKSRRAPSKHPLLAYQRLGQRFRTIPLVIVIAVSMLLALSWLSTQDLLPGVDIEQLHGLWEQRALLILAVAGSGMLFLFALIIGGSFVEARPKILHVRAGLLAVNISYKRVRQIRLSQVGIQYPETSLKGGDYSLLAPLLATPCSVVDLYGWPSPGKSLLQRLWSKFMFSGDSASLMLIVRDAMVLNQQIDGRIAERQHRDKDKGYIDPIERATRMQKSSGAKQ